MTLPPAPERVAQRLKEQFAPAYLTLTSIIQGVALTALLVRVEALYPRFGAVDWVLAVTTFLVLVDIWHEYLMTVLAYVWTPTLLDTLIPFGFLAAELFLAQFVDDLRPWCCPLASSPWSVQARGSRASYASASSARTAKSMPSWRARAATGA